MWMLMHFFFAPVLVIAILAFVVVRILTAPFRYGRWHRRRYGCGYGPGWGYGGYGYRPGRSLLGIVLLVALERIFSGRRYW